MIVINANDIFKFLVPILIGGFGGFIYLKMLKHNIANIVKGKKIILNAIAGFLLRIGLCATIFTSSAYLFGTTGFISACCGFFLVRSYILAKEKGGIDVNKS